MKNFMLKKYILLFRSGQTSVFFEIYSNYKNLINRYAKTFSDEDARQEFTLLLIEILYNVKLENFTEDTSDTIHRYILVSLKHKFITLKKSQMLYANRRLQLFNNFTFEDECISEIDSYDMLTPLSPAQRKVIVWKYFYCLSDVEIASMLGISRQAVNSLKNRGIETLRINLDK